MYMSEDLKEKISRIENEILGLIITEKSKNKHCLCNFHKAQVAENASRSGCKCGQLSNSNSVRSCPTDWQHNETPHMNHKQKKKPSTSGGACSTCGCCKDPKDLKRPASSPTSTSCRCNQRNVTFCFQPENINKYLESVENPKKGDYDIARTSPCPSGRKSSMSLSKTISGPVKCQCRASKTSSSQDSGISRSGSCMDEIKQLRQDICCIKHQMHEINSTKDEALDVTQELQKRYERLFIQKTDLQNQIYMTKRENELLEEKLRECARIKDTTEAQLKDAKEMLNSYKKHADSLREQTVRGSQILDEAKEEFCECIRQRDDEISKLKDNNSELSKQIEQRDKENKSLCKKCTGLKTKVSEAEEKMNSLKESNDKLCCCIKKLEEDMERIKQDCEGCKQENSTLKSELSVKCACLEETKAQKEALQKELTNTKGSTEKQLNYCCTKEKQMQCQLVALTQKIKELQTELRKATEDAHETDRLKQENKRLNDKYNILARKMQAMQEKDKEKRSTVTDELRKCSKAIEDKEKCYLKERNELRRLVDELTDVVKQNKATLLHLSSVNKQQEELLKSQAASLESKDAEIKNCEDQTCQVRKRANDLEKQVTHLKKCVCKFEKLNKDFDKVNGPVQEQSFEAVLKELENTRAALKAEKENLLVKQKIIDDQAATICSLKSKLKEKSKIINKIQNDLYSNAEESKTLQEQLMQLQESFDEEAREKDAINNELMKIEEQKKVLTYKVNELEKIVNCYCNNEEENISKQQKLINTLEQQIQVQRREWELQKRMLMKEKDKALHAARFATEKLLETVADFQKQVDSHKKIQKVLANMLQEKDMKLQDVTAKINSITAIAQTAHAQVGRTKKCCKGIEVEELYKGCRRKSSSSPPSAVNVNAYKQSKERACTTSCKSCR